MFHKRSCPSNGSRNLSEKGRSPMTCQTCGLTWRPSFSTSFNRGRGTRACGPPLGSFTYPAQFCINIFTSLLQVIGMFITYFVILVQFKPSEGSTDHEILEMKRMLQNLTQFIFTNMSTSTKGL